jgi:hypothetical protein
MRITRPSTELGDAAVEIWRSYDDRTWCGAAAAMHFVAVPSGLIREG